MGIDRVLRWFEEAAKYTYHCARSWIEMGERIKDIDERSQRQYDDNKILIEGVRTMLLAEKDHNRDRFNRVHSRIDEVLLLIAERKSDRG